MEDPGSTKQLLSDALARDSQEAATAMFRMLAICPDELWVFADDFSVAYSNANARDGEFGGEPGSVIEDFPPAICGGRLFGFLGGILVGARCVKARSGLFVIRAQINTPVQ